MEIKFFTLPNSIYFLPQFCFSWGGSKRIFIGWLNFYWLIIFKSNDIPNTEMDQKSV